MRRILSPLATLPVAALLFASPGAGQTRSVVPMTLTQSDHGGGRVYLPVRVNTVMGAMRLDTGASTSRIKLATWNKDLPVAGHSVSAAASGEAMRCEDVQASLVALKASEGNDIARGRYEVTRCATSAGDDLLGLDFFKGARVTLDVARRELVFFGDGAATAHPLRRIGPDGRLVGVDAKIGEVAVTALFDTGAEVCAVDQAFVARHKRLFARTKDKASARGAGGESFSSRLYRIRQLDLGDGRIVRDIDALVYDFGPLRDALGRQTPLILGYNVISRFVWNLDFTAPDKPMWDARGR